MVIMIGKELTAKPSIEYFFKTINLIKSAFASSNECWDLKDWISINKVNASFGKLKEELIAEGCKEKRNNTARGWAGIKIIPKVIPPVAAENT
jgi:hypothetical protein